MRTPAKYAATIAAAGLLAACGINTDPPGAQVQPTPGAAETTGPDRDASGDQGVTTADDVFGPGCDQLPGDANAPVGEAAGGTPALGRLTEALRTAGLADVLNDRDAAYTVFAPSNAAFDALPGGPEQVLGAPRDELADILLYHVVPERHDAESLTVKQRLITAQGAELRISGDGNDLVVGGRARVVCANVPTANATVFIIDSVLAPP